MNLCADAGGTSLRLAYVDDENKIIDRKKYAIERFPSGEKGIIAALNTYIDETKDFINPENIKNLVISAAGQIKNRSVQFTNADWFVSELTILKEFRGIFSDCCGVSLINDFEALAYGITALGEEDTQAIFSREGFGDTSIVCGPGTGLGLSAVKQSGSSVVVIPSEGGHQSFAAETGLEREIRAQLMDEWVSYEHILSGEGLQFLFNFFAQRANAPNVSEQSPESIVALYNSSNIAAIHALEAFAYALGSFCGNMALALGATRGVYLWGGILKEFPIKLLKNNMMRRFHQRGRAAAFVADIPVYKIVNENVALIGCSIFANSHDKNASN